MPKTLFAGTILALGLALAAPVKAQVTQATMLDRLQIEDLITRYYGDLGHGASAFGKYYIPDAELDVNGRVARGPQAIEQLYRDLAAANRGGPTNSGGTFHMLLSNPVIEVKGATAVARFIWTGILNDKIKNPPHFVEQGREYDVLVKRAGQWRIRKRVIIADSGLPDFFDKTYTPRKDYDPLKD